MLLVACSRPPAPGPSGTDGGDAPTTLRVLFIGNSFTAVNDLPATVARLGDAARPSVRFEVEQYTPGGQTWEGHDADPAVEALISGSRWDYVVLQDQSEQAWSAGGVKDALRSLDAKVKAAGASTVLYMTWAQRADLARASGTTRFIEDVALAWYYQTSAEVIGARVAPVGRAWERALRFPGNELHADDGSHPNPRGTYLAACVFYATLTGLRPTGPGDGELGVPPEDAAALQDLAWETTVARQRPPSPLVGAWPFGAAPSGNDLVISDGLVLGGEVAPAGAGATQFGQDRFAVIPYEAGLNTAHMTVAVSVFRPDWALSAGALQAPVAPDEYIVSKYDAYALYQAGTDLVAEVHTVDQQLPPPLRFSVAGLSPGWHHVAFTYDGTTYALWVDHGLVASAATSGDLRASAQGIQASQGIAVGGRPTGFVQSIVDDEPARFSGRLADLQIYDRALNPPAAAYRN